MSVLVAPEIRTRHHDLLEASHRFGTWLVLILVWVNSLLLANLQIPERSFISALATSPIVWMLVILTGIDIWPWLLLRSVPISFETFPTNVWVTTSLRETCGDAFVD